MSVHDEHVKNGEFKRTCKQCLIRRIREISDYYGAEKGENYRVSDEILTRDALEGLLDYLQKQVEENQRQQRLRENMHRFFGREPEPRVESEEDRLNRQLRKMAETETSELALVTAKV